MSGHSILSASGSHKWLVCPPSVLLEQEYPDEGSKYAAEGTLAHRLGELWLRYNLGQVSKADKNAKEAAIMRDPLYAPEMSGYVEGYITYVWERYQAAKATYSEAELLVEARLDYSDVAPGGSGTGDAVIVSDKYIEVIDLKYGVGVSVDVRDNPQLKLYGYGAYRSYSFMYDFEAVAMTVYQPRLDNILTDSFSVDELVVWTKMVVMPAAQLAIKGEGDYSPGEHCDRFFCRARGDCKARAKENIRQAQGAFGLGDTMTPSADRLTAEEIGRYLAQGRLYAAWYKNVEDYAYDQALNHGASYPGWKLVAGRSVRKIQDEGAAEKALKAAGYKTNDYTTKKLKGITELEKLLGKTLDTVLGALVTKPPGKPALVPEKDPRPELNDAAEAFKDMEEN